MPEKKSPGPDGITTEMLVAAGEVGILELTELSNMIHNQGSFPSELNKSIFITLPKVNGTIKCEKHRTISLMSHVTKLVLRIVINIIRRRTSGDIAPVQYGFMTDKGTGNAIFVLRRLVERSVEKQRDVYTSFIDSSKAFDTVKHESLVPTTPACTWWNRPEEDLSSGKSESTHPSRTVVKLIEVFYGVESVVRGNADSLLN